MNREVHVRIWERPEVRVLWATRHEHQFAPPRPSDRCGFAQETFAGVRGNDRDAPLAAVSVCLPRTEHNQSNGSLWLGTATASVGDPRHPIHEEIDQLAQKLDPRRSVS